MGSNMPKGFCQCGCGATTKIIAEDNRTYGQVKGEPFRFIRGHNTAKGSDSLFWKGGRSDSAAYPRVSCPGHPRSDRTTDYVLEHVLIAEKALGKPLPCGAEIHHHGPVKDQCIVICQDRAYHMILEQRTRAWKACGDPNKRKCGYCKTYDDPSNLKIYDTAAYHAKCHAMGEWQRRRAKQTNPKAPEKKK